MTSASTILTAIMEAVLQKQPTKLALLRPLLTNTLDTLKLNYLWDISYKSDESRKKCIEAVTQLLYLAAARQSV